MNDHIRSEIILISNKSCLISFFIKHVKPKSNTVSCFFLVFNATFNNISVISWPSVLFMDETGVPGENH